MFITDTDWDVVEAYRLFDNLLRLGKIIPIQQANSKPARVSASPIYRQQQPVVRNVPIVVQQQRTEPQSFGQPPGDEIWLNAVVLPENVETAYVCLK